MESQRLSPLREEKTWFAALTEELEEFLDAGGIDDLASETEAEHKFGVSHVSRFATCSMRQRKVRMAPPEYRPAPLCRGRVIRLPGVVGTVPLRRIW